MTEADRIQVQRALDNHARLQFSYFWSDNGNGAARSARERKLNFRVEVEAGGHTYEYASQVSISRKNFRYTGRFSKDGIKGDVRLFKGLLNGGS